MRNKGKLNLLNVIISAFLTTIITLAVPIGFRWISMECAVITISPSVECNENFLTVINVQNLEEKTQSNLSLFFDNDVEVLEIQSSHEFDQHQQYLMIEKLLPKAQYGVMVWSAQPILKGQVIAESGFKTRIDYPNDRSPFLVQMLWFVIPFGILTFFATGIRIWIDWRHRIIESKKLQERLDALQKEKEQIDEEHRSQKAELESIKEALNQASKESEEQREYNKKEIRELRSYMIAIISQLRKELSFWRDTVRKLLYNSQNEFQTADKIIETVTLTLKTYATRKRSDENMDELLYLAQLIADSRELHSKHNSVE